MATHVLDQIVRQTKTHTREAVEAILADEAACAFDAIEKGGGRIVERGDNGLRYTAIAKDYARLSPADRARTLVLDPTREERQRLTDAIRAELIRDGTLGAKAIAATTLEPVGLTRAEASDAASYAPGQIVTFRRGSREQRLSRGRAYRVESIAAEAGTVSLATPQGKAVACRRARPSPGRPPDGVATRPRRLSRLNRSCAPGTGYSSPATTGTWDATMAISRASSGSIRSVATSRSSAGTANARRSTSPVSPIDISGPDGFALSTPPKARPQIGSWPIWRASAPTPSMLRRSMSPYPAPRMQSRSTPIAAPSSPNRSTYSMARRSKRSMRSGARSGLRWDSYFGKEVRPHLGHGSTTKGKKINPWRSEVIKPWPHFRGLNDFITTNTKHNAFRPRHINLIGPEKSIRGMKKETAPI